MSQLQIILDGDLVKAQVTPLEGMTVGFSAARVHNRSSGYHASTRITFNGKLLASDLLNFEKNAQRKTLGNDAHAMMPEDLRDAYPKLSVKQDLDEFCEAIWDTYNSQFKAEMVAGDPDSNTEWFCQPMIMQEATTILFGKRGAGKSVTAMACAVSTQHGISNLWNPIETANVLYINIERGEKSMARRIARVNTALGLSAYEPLLMVNARGKSLEHIYDAARRSMRVNEVQIVFFDSISRAGAGDLNENQPANQVMDMLSALSPTWLAVAHMTEQEGGKSKVFGCHSADTDVLTRAGWKAHGEVTLDDKVACFDPDNNLLEWQSPTELHEYNYQGEMVYLTGKMLDILVTPNHRMLFKHRTWRGNNHNIFPREWQWTTAGSLSRNFRLPAIAPIMTGEAPLTLAVGPAELETQALMSYLGWFISEGSVAKKGGTVASIAQAKGPLATRILETTQRLGFNPRVTKVIPKPREGYAQEREVWYIATRYVPWFARWLVEHCGQGAPNKRIPPMVFGLAYHLRRLLFDALMEGDGNWYAENAGSYSTTSAQLADDFQMLASTLGIATTTSRPRLGSKSNRLQYRVHLRRSTTMGATFQQGNIQTVPYDGMVYCLTVPTGAYLTRRNGKVAITGNSQMYENAADVVMKLTGDSQGNQLGVGMEIVKGNDTALGQNQYLKYEFNGTGLAAITPSSLSDFPDLASKASLLEGIRSVLSNRPESVNDIAAELNETTKKVTATLRSSSSFIRSGNLWALPEKQAEPSP